MTAPLAWVGAVPFERFLTPAWAVSASLLTFTAVVLWRIALMVRVLMVLWNYWLAAALAVVGAFAAGLALCVPWFIGVPIFPGKGSWVSESDWVLYNAGCSFLFLGACTAPLWLSALLYALTACRATWQGPVRTAPTWPSLPLWTAALGSLAIWAAILLYTQPPQQLRWAVEHDLREQRIGLALEKMSAHAPDDFPPLWQPPPRWIIEPHGPYTDDESCSRLIDVWEVLATQPSASWVRESYLAKLRHVAFFAGNLSARDLSRLVHVLGMIPEGPALVGELDRLDGLRTNLRNALPENLRPKERAPIQDREK
jgi:hypothetical protein